MAANGDQAREQDVGEMFSGCVPGDGHVPRPDGVDSVAAAAQPALQRDGRPPKPQLDGVPIAIILRFMSAVDFASCSSPIRSLRWRLQTACSLLWARLRFQF